MGFNLGMALGAAGTAGRDTFLKLREEARQQDLYNRANKERDAVNAGIAAIPTDQNDVFAPLRGSQPSDDATPTPDGQPQTTALPPMPKTNPTGFSAQAPVGLAPELPGAPGAPPAQGAMPTQTPPPPAASEIPDVEGVTVTGRRNQYAGTDPLAMRKGGFADQYYGQSNALLQAAKAGGPNAAALFMQAMDLRRKGDEMRVNEGGAAMSGAWARGGADGFADFMESVTGTRPKISMDNNPDSLNYGEITAQYGNGPVQRFQSPDQMINTITASLSADPSRYANVINQGLAAENNRLHYMGNMLYHRSIASIRQTQDEALAELRRAQAANQNEEAEARKNTANLVGQIGGYMRAPELYENEIGGAHDQLMAIGGNPQKFGHFYVDPTTGQQGVRYYMLDNADRLAAHNRAIISDPAFQDPNAQPVLQGKDPNTGKYVYSHPSIIKQSELRDPNTNQIVRGYRVAGDLTLDPKDPTKGFYMNAAEAAKAARKVVAAREKEKQPSDQVPASQPSAATPSIYSGPGMR